MRYLTRFLSLNLILSSFFALQGCWQQPTGAEGEGTEGTPSQPPTLPTAAQIGSPSTNPVGIGSLTDLNTIVRNNPTGNFRLTAHIDMGPAAGWNGGAGWAPIETFSGTFDGNGFQIRNLTMNRPEHWVVGLFGQYPGQWLGRRAGWDDQWFPSQFQLRGRDDKGGHQSVRFGILPRPFRRHHQQLRRGPFLYPRDGYRTGHRRGRLRRPHR
jgi:hypothetical protein